MLFCVIKYYLFVNALRNSSMFYEDRKINREYVYTGAVYQKYLTGLGELIIFEP